MAKVVTRKAFAPKPPKAVRVAAYARVSSAKDAMHHSLSAQVSYYSELIQKHPGWEYVGVYADEAKTGTKDTRVNFQRLIADCRDGKIDMIITKSISRFARNTLTLLETVRALKDKGINVYFEEQHIYSLSMEGELMLTILASFAQEESRSASENQKWRILKNFREGIPWNGAVLGYRQKDGKYVIQADEAAIVRRIFAEYLSGKGTIAIAKGLNSDGIPTRLGVPWRHTSVAKILHNYNYTGNLMLQRTFSNNHLEKKKVTNNGEKPKYHAVGTHEAIIPLVMYEAVQAEMARRTDRYKTKTPHSVYPFSSKIVCAKCGKHYRRKTTATGVVWICQTYNDHGKAACASKQIPECVLTERIGDNPDEIDRIIAKNGNLLTIHYKDGNSAEIAWEDRSRSNSWTEEKKRLARQIRQRSNNHG